MKISLNRHAKHEERLPPYRVKYYEGTGIRDELMRLSRARKKRPLVSIVTFTNRPYPALRIIAIEACKTRGVKSIALKTKDGRRHVAVFRWFTRPRKILPTPAECLPCSSSEGSAFLGWIRVLAVAWPNPALKTGKP